jgi:hypothetical protein
MANVNSVRLSMEAHVRLIAAFDKNIPCWLKTNHRPRRIDDFVRQVNVALGIVVREAGGHITVAEAYRKLSHPTGEDYRPLTIENFLQMLPSIGCIVIEFKDPQAPTLRLGKRNGENLRVQIQTDQPSAPEKTSPEAIPLFGVKSVFRERATIERC